MEGVTASLTHHGSLQCRHCRRRRRRVRTARKQVAVATAFVVVMVVGCAARTFGGRFQSRSRIAQTCHMTGLQRIGRGGGSSVDETSDDAEPESLGEEQEQGESNRKRRRRRRWPFAGARGGEQEQQQEVAEDTEEMLKSSRNATGQQDIVVATSTEVEEASGRPEATASTAELETNSVDSTTKDDDSDVDEEKEKEEVQATESSSSQSSPLAQEDGEGEEHDSVEGEEQTATGGQAEDVATITTHEEYIGMDPMEDEASTIEGGNGNSKGEDEDSVGDTPEEDGNDSSSTESLAKNDRGKDDESSEEEADSPPPSTLASDLRAEGKVLHDNGQYPEAAEIFSRAAVQLESSMMDSESKDNTLLVEEWGTCRLHEALCRLKSKEYAACVKACTAVLDDGVEVGVVEETTSSENDDTENENEDVKERTPTKMIIVTARQDQPGGKSSSRGWFRADTIAPAVRARAFHRRAKARLALEDRSGALDDARSAAFLGDRNAVALYGKLMREASSNGGSSPDGSAAFPSSPFSPSSSLLSGLFNGAGGENAFGSGMSNGSGPDSSALLSALLNGSGLLGGPGANDASTPELEGDKKRRWGLGKKKSSSAVGVANQKQNPGMDGLAKSLLGNLAKRIEDEETQKNICHYLNSATSTQIKSAATLAGVPIGEQTADRLEKFAHGMTPKTLKRGVKWTKRTVVTVNFARRVVKVFNQYRHVLILLLLIQWTKSSVLRPPPVNHKKAAAAAAAAAKAGVEGDSLTAAKQALEAALCFFP